MNLQDAAYDAVAIEAWKDSICWHLLDFRPLPRNYHSIWRILHIDGFEDGKLLQFRRYSPMGEFNEEIAEES